MSCLFCKIIDKEVPSEIVYEDERFLAFRDIHPKAPLHILIVPKKHISSINELKTEDKELMGRFLLTAKEIAKKLGLSKIGYKLIFNVGKGGGQLIEHLHLHLLSGKPVQLP